MIRLPFVTRVDDCIESHCRQAPDAHSVSLWGGGQWHPVTRGDFWQRVEYYAERFSGTFQEPGLVLFIKRLDLDLLAAYIGAMRGGMIPAQLSPFSAKTSASEYQRKIEHIVTLTGCVGLFTDAAESARFEGLDTLRILTPDTGWSAPGPLRRAHESAALVQFSSGSTGLQKGVLLTHEALMAHMRDYTAALALDESDRLVSWLPLYHDMGLIACYLMPLMAGISCYLMDPFDWIMRPDLLLEAIETHRATLCYLPNFAYHVLIKKGKPRDLSSMRLFINCSEPVRRATHDAFLAHFPSVKPEAMSICYALAENTFAVSQVPVGCRPGTRALEGKEVISCGKVLPNTEVCILEANEDGVGEVAIRGPYGFSSYLNGAPSMEDGYYRTGDLGYLTADGELYISGRKKDLIIVNGKNVYPQDVEHAASHLPGVYPGRVVAFGIENDQTGSEELYVVVERDGTVADTPLKLTVQRSVDQEVGILPKRVEIVDHMRLVKTSSGKISRSRNKELFLSGELVQG